ncbi:glycosyltransferase family 4 protein, partial [Vibrio sp. FNV 38]|nr:glycosyltransferase family 4 protein [Vibrio sp. FNV 38]
LGLEDSIEITGRLDEKRFARLSECRIACMPSRFEGWGITAIEAAAEGIPVIASDIEGLREAVQDNETGVLIESNPQNLANAIKDLLSNPDRIQALSQNAKKHASKFHWESIANEQRAIYESLI